MANRNEMSVPGSTTATNVAVVLVYMTCDVRLLGILAPGDEVLAVS